MDDKPTRPTFRWENPSDPDNIVIVTFDDDGGLTIILGDERWGHPVEVMATLPNADAERLRKFIASLPSRQ